MEGGFGMFTNKSVQLLVGLHFRPWAYLTTTVFIQRRLRHDFTRDADGIAELLPVLLGRHIVEQDARVLARIFGFDLHPATARGAHRTDVCLETVLFHRITAVVVNRYRQEMILNVRPGKLFTAADKTTGFKLVTGTNTAAIE
ncbi:hypothetical protein D3C73_907100 [compost metagenome]